LKTPQGTLASPFGLDPQDGYTWLKGNVHTHTTNSDGRETPEQRLDGYVNQGYGFLCLSDHGTITRTDGLQAPDGFVLIQGAELHPPNPFGGQVHHFVALNIEEDIGAEHLPPQLVIDRVAEQGGQAWLAHPHWSSVNILRDIMPLRGLSGLEVFNTICRNYGRGESAVHWDDWMSLADRLYPALGSDDSHAAADEKRNTYQSWTMVRVKERTVEAVLAALVSGTSYASTGPEIRDIQIRLSDESTQERRVAEATVDCSEARRIAAICDVYGAEYDRHGETFETATFPLMPNARWARFEIIGPDGSKAWSNPFDLTAL